MPLYLYKYSLKDKFYTMKKLLLFFSKPIVGGILSLIGLLEILFSIPSSYITYAIPLWIIVLSSFICLALQIPQRRRRCLLQRQNLLVDVWPRLPLLCHHHCRGCRLGMSEVREITN